MKAGEPGPTGRQAMDTVDPTVGSRMDPASSRYPVTVTSIPSQSCRAPRTSGTAHVPPVPLRTTSRAGARASSGASEAGSKGAVSAALSFPLKAPDTLAGMPRREVRLVTGGKENGALVTYGTGLGGIAVVEHPAQASKPAPAGSGHDQQLTLPKVTINGTPATELPTALGTGVQFTRGGVAYVVVGSVTPAVAEAAARGL